VPVLATTTVHTMTRLDIATAVVFDKFRDAFEHAAPIFDAAAGHEIAAGGAWDGVRAAVASNAPNALPSIGPVVTDASSPTDRSVMTSIPGARAAVWSAPR
jgi:hypothetical protein